MARSQSRLDEALALLGIMVQLGFTGWTRIVLHRDRHHRLDLYASILDAHERPTWVAFVLGLATEVDFATIDRYLLLWFIEYSLVDTPR